MWKLFEQGTLIDVFDSILEAISVKRAYLEINPDYIYSITD